MSRHPGLRVLVIHFCYVVFALWGCSGSSPANTCNSTSVGGAGAASPCPTGGAASTVGGSSSAGTSSIGGSSTAGGSSSPWPPDPATVAPPIDPTVATDIASATAFIYEGANPIQTGVAPGTIEARRVAILRGKVNDRGGAPIAGVKITVLSHPELGQTLTRADGMFDLAVNGGGQLTVNYAKDGLLSYLPVQRSVNAPWRDYVWLPES